jgi:Tol biopolymer transport system component
MPEPIAYSLSSGALFSISANGVLAYRGKGATFESQLVWIDRTGKRLATVGGPADIRQIALAPDERTVAVSRADAETGSDDIWMLDLVRGTATRFTADPLNDWFPVWSPDGARVVFASDREGGWSLFEKSIAGTAAEQRVLKSSIPTFATSWSPDGRFVLYHGGPPETKDDLMLFDVAGGSSAPFLRSRFNESHGSFSPDGCWVAYSSDETGTSEVYIQRFDTSASPPRGARKWQISTSGGYQPQWRRDGKELYYATVDRKLMAVDISTSGDSLKAGLPHALFDIHFDTTPTTSVAYAPSRDGQRFLVTASVDQARPSPIAVAVNWAANLKR